MIAVPALLPLLVVVLVVLCFTMSSAESRSDCQSATVTITQPGAARLMYISASPKLVAVVELGADGALTRRSELDVALPGNAKAMTFLRQQRRLFVGYQPTSVATVDVDAQGVPKLVGSTDLGGGAVYLETVNDGKTLVAAYFGDNRMTTHDMSGGTNPFRETERQSTPSEPHQIIAAPSGLLYVPHRSADVVRWFSVDAGGKLQQRGEWKAKKGDGPRHMTFFGSNAYLINEFGNTVSVFDVASDGALTLRDTLSSLPADFAGSSTGADIHVTQSGRFVYASNRGHDSIAVFARAADGTLTARGHAATEQTPREFSLTPDDRFVVVCGQGSGHVHSLRVDSDGTLQSVARLPVGDDLRWAIIL